ncbi:MAG TPA: histidine phosphatase family protein [Methylomirabilota bacterium]|jgi:probable phosphoglycerate mutase|nr:histidine phosphatase family protein [Methylomirabilota bacterium]
MTRPGDAPRHQIWLIRHGETEWSASGQHTGRTDIPLTPTGEVQAAALGRYLAGRPFALVLTSPLGRARETCRLAGYGVVAQVTDDLLEWNYGVFEGRTTRDIRQERPGWSIWTSPVPEGESVEQVGARARRVIDRAAAAGGDVALFAHAHILRILAACWIGLPPAGGRLFALGTASISVLGYEREVRVISVWNQDWHLVRQENP